MSRKVQIELALFESGTIFIHTPTLQKVLLTQDASKKFYLIDLARRVCAVYPVQNSRADGVLSYELENTGIWNQYEFAVEEAREIDVGSLQMAR